MAQPPRCNTMLMELGAQGGGPGPRVVMAHHALIHASWVGESHSPHPTVPPPHGTTFLSHLEQLIVVEITDDQLQWQPRPA